MKWDEDFLEKREYRGVINQFIPTCTGMQERRLFRLSRANLTNFCN